MALLRVSSWITGRFRKQTNEVTPIEIIVQPRQHEQNPGIDFKVDDEFSVFAIEDEIRFVRLWYPNANCNASSAATLKEDDKCEAIEMSELPFRPTSAEVPVIFTNDFIGTSFNATPRPPQTSPQRLSVRSCTQKICNSAILAKQAILKARREKKPQSYIQSYLNIMHVFCVSAIRTNTNQPMNVAGLQNWSRWIATKLNLAIFVLFAFFSAFQSFCQAKYDVLWFLFEGGLNQFVKFSFNVTSLVTSAYCSYSLCREWETVRKMADVMSSYELKWTSITKHSALCVVLASITTLLASCMTLFISDIRNFSIENAMLESSYQMSEDLFLWSSQNLTVSIRELDEEFGTDLNSIEIVFAVIKIVRDFAYFLQDGMFWDLIGCVAFTLFCWIKFYIKFVTEVVDNVLDETSNEWIVLQQKREQVWRMYREIRIVFEAVNNVFDPLLIFFHASNVLRYAFFVENLIYPGNITPLALVHLLYNIVKSEITYIVASRIAQENKIIRKWLRNWGSRNGNVDVGYTEINITAVLDELEEEPLGLGKGDFVINQKFHFGLLDLVSSLFVMLAGKKE